MRTLFAPILAGASLRDRLLACLGAAVGVALVAAAANATGILDPALPWLLAPIGASAVLVFAVPASPLAQPWPVAGGNTVSALVGVLVVHALPLPTVAAGGLAVGAAILIMSLLRCLHPPGGAMALTAVIGGPLAAKAGWWLPIPAALDSAVLVAAGLLFHRWSGHSYPHRAAPAPPLAPPLAPEDLDAVLADLGESFDIAPEDLATIVRAVEERQLRPRASSPS